MYNFSQEASIAKDGDTTGKCFVNCRATCSFSLFVELPSSEPGMSVESGTFAVLYVTLPRSIPLERKLLLSSKSKLGDIKNAVSPQGYPTLTYFVPEAVLQVFRIFILSSKRNLSTNSWREVYLSNLTLFAFKAQQYRALIKDE